MRRRPRSDDDDDYHHALHSVGWAQLVHAEIVGVVSAMRKNARFWGSGGLQQQSQTHHAIASSSMAFAEANNGSIVGISVGEDGRARRRVPGAGLAAADSSSRDYDYCADVAASSPAATVTAIDAVADFAYHRLISQQQQQQSQSVSLSQLGSVGSSRNSIFNPAGGGASGYVVQENPLLHAFTRLKAKLTLIRDLKDLEPMQLLSPFLDVIRSGDTTGPITGAALASVEKFIKYNILDPKHPGMPAAMSALTHSVTHCKFEATDVISDEVVLAKILRLIRVAISSEVGQKTLDDRGICEMVETGFGICLQGRMSELLRRSAEQTLVILVQALFERLSVIMNYIENRNSSSVTNNLTVSPAEDQDAPFVRSRSHNSVSNMIHGAADEPAPSISVDGTGNTAGATIDQTLIALGSVDVDPSVNHGEEIDGLILNAAGVTLNQQSSFTSTQDDSSKTGGVHIQIADGTKVRTRKSLGNINHLSLSSQQNQSLSSIEGGESPTLAESTTAHAGNLESADTVGSSTAVTNKPAAPFGLPAILELLRVLVTLIDPRNRNHTDMIHRMVALGLLNVAIEVGGVALGTWVAWGRRVEYARRAGDEVAESEEDKMAAAARELVVNELTKYLFQLLQGSNITAGSPPSSSALTLFTLNLRVATSLFLTVRPHLRLQLEWLLEWIMNKVNGGVVGWDVEDYTSSSSSNNPSPTPSAMLQRDTNAIANAKAVVVPEVRELLLETLVQFFKNQQFFAELWVGYDGDMAFQSHMFEDLIRFLSKHSFPDATPGGPVTTLTHQTLCLDALLIFLKTISDRVRGDDVGSTEPTVTPTPEELLNIKHRKRVLKEGAQKFNAKPKEGIAFLQANGFLPDPVDPKSLAVFLKGTPSVNKTLLGDYLGRPANVDVLKAFVQLYDFKGKRLDEALRLFLESFRLPGEAQQIDRIVQVFADWYFEALKDSQPSAASSDTAAARSETPKHVGSVAGTSEMDGSTVAETVSLADSAVEQQQPEAKKYSERIADASSTYVLAFSIILLNTDLHNPQVKRRMTKDDFKRNTRGCNDGKDFDPEYLGKVYDAIKENEIVMPEEHEGDLGFNYAWRELLKRAEIVGGFLPCDGGRYDRDMFAAVWMPAIAAVSYAFDNAEDNLTLQKAVVGFHSCAAIASRYGLVEILDNIVISLSKITGLLKDNGPIPPPDRGIRPELDDSGTVQRRVDRWAVEFGRSFKGQVAAVLMFNLAAEYGNSLREGWTNVVTIVSNLFLHSLLPISLLIADDFIARAVKITRLVDARDRPATNNTVVRKDAGLLSTLSQFLSLSTGMSDDTGDYDPTAEELDAERFTVECISACRIEELFADTKFLEVDALKHLITVICQLLLVPVRQAAAPVTRTSSSAGIESRQSVSSPTSQQPPAPLPTQPQLKYGPASIFLLELLVRITMQNRDRAAVVWPLTVQQIASILGDPTDKPAAVLERAVVGLIRLIIRLIHQDEIVSTVVQSLDLIRSLPHETLMLVAEQSTAGILTLVKLDPSLLIRQGLWDTTVQILTSTSLHPDAARFGFEAACLLTGDSPDAPVTMETFGECVDLLLSFASAAGGIVLANGGLGTGAAATTDSRSGSPRMPRRSPSKNVAAQPSVDRAIGAIERLFKLQNRIPELIRQGSIRQERAWFEFWLPILSGLGQQCYHPSREVRQHALALLQRALLSPELEGKNVNFGPDVTPATVETWVACFGDVIFPLLDELLKPEVFRLDPSGMDETRMRAAALLCKIFLQYVQRLLRYKDLPGLWVDILEYMHKYMRASTQEYLFEGVLESLKNMLLVMSTQGVFQPAEGPGSAIPLKSQHNLWDITWKTLADVLPGLKDELFPAVNFQQELPPKAPPTEMMIPSPVTPVPVAPLVSAQPVETVVSPDG